ncbi:MAG: c-type cytochrome domain-containing protein [Planctomycetaceae bacterium]
MPAVAVADDDEEAPITPADVKLDRPVEFERDIYPILEANCLACHNLATAESDLVVESAEAMLKGGNYGPAIVPEKPEDSYLYRLAARHEEPAMPPWPNDVQAKKLTPEQLGLLKQWILEGAKAGAAASAANMNWQAINDQLHAIYAVSVDGTGRFVAAGRAGSVTIYDLIARQNQKSLADPDIQLPSAHPLAHRDYVHAVAFHPDGELLATAGYQIVKFWTRNFQEAVRPSEVAAEAVTTPDSAAGVTVKIEGASANLVKTDSPEERVATITTPADISDFALSSDAQRLATVSSDNVARLWNAADGALIADLTKDLPAARQLARRETDKAVREARVGVVNGQITEAEKQVTEQQEALKKADEALAKAKTSRDEAATKLTEAEAKTAEAKKAAEEKPDDEAVKKQVEEATKAEQAATDAVTTADNELKSAEKSKQLTEAAITRAQAHVDEKKQLLATVEAELKQSVETLEQAKVPAAAPVSAAFVAFVGDGSLLATLDTSGTVRLWKTADGSAVDVLPLLGNSPPVADVTSQGDSLLVRHQDGSVSDVSVFPQWQLSARLGTQDDGSSVFSDRVLSLAFSPDGTLLAAGGGEASRSGQVTIWNVTDRTLVREIPDAHSDTVYGLEFSPDGKRLATASADKFVKVFDVATGEHVRSYEGHTHHVMDVSWKGDGATLASAGADNAIKVWNAETGEQARTITTYSKQVTSLEFVGMQDEFISSSGDRRIFRHRAGDGAGVREFSGCPDYVYCTAVTFDGSIVAAGCEDGILRVWNGADGAEVAKFEPAK